MRNPFMCWFEHVDSRCGHMSIVLFGYNVQFRFGCVFGQKTFFSCDHQCIGHTKILAFVLFVRMGCWGISKSGWRVCG